MQEPQGGVVVVYATFPDRAAALTCGRAMVEAGIAGCINVLPAMTSIYVWKGVTETAEEAVMIAKVASEMADAAVAFVAANHSYEMPAILVLPVAGGSGPYLDWIRGSIGRDASERPI